MFVGINSYDGKIYEGVSTTSGYGVWPQPFFSQAAFYSSYPTSSEVPIRTHTTGFTIIYREDYFDPITRIRRGRFYERAKNLSSPVDWISQPHPTLNAYSVSPHDGELHINLTTFESILSIPIIANKKSNFVTLGDSEAHSVWKVIAVERIQTGDLLVTLKNLSLGELLPDLDPAKLSSDALSKISPFLEKVIDEANRAGPASVVDRCRDAAAALISWGKPPTGYKTGDDLFAILSKMDKENEIANKEMIFHCGNIIRILHSRAKPAIQEKYSPRELRQEDAVLAVSSLASMIRDLGFAQN